LITGGEGKKKKTGAFLADDKFNFVIKLFSGFRERTAWFRAAIVYEAVR
jgi:hypothetical protein